MFSQTRPNVIKIPHKRRPTSQFLCLNPSCNTNQRFHGPDEVSNHANCQGWVINNEDMELILKQATSTETGNIILNFKKEPIKSVFVLQSMFKNSQDKNKEGFFQRIPSQQNDPIQRLKLNFDQLRIKIYNQLERVFYEVQERIQQLRKVQKNTVNEIKSILTLQQQFKILESIQNSAILKQYKEFCNIIGTLNLINQQKASKQINKIFDSISGIGKSFWSRSIDSSDAEQQITNQSLKMIQNFNQNEQMHPASKLQALLNYCKIKNFQPSISQNKLIFQMKCWICNQLYTGDGNNIRQRRASVSRKLTSHVLQAHKYQIVQNFREDILKKSVNRISFAQFISQIEQFKYKQFIIIDRENRNNKQAFSVVKQRIPQNAFVLDVVSYQNQKIASGKYIVARSRGRDAADIMIVILVYAIISSGYYRYRGKLEEQFKPKIVILTTDHFAQTFKDILQGQFAIEIQIRT